MGVMSLAFNSEMIVAAPTGWNARARTPAVITPSGRVCESVIEVCPVDYIRIRLNLGDGWRSVSRLGIGWLPTRHAALYAIRIDTKIHEIVDVELGTSLVNAQKL
jgi:hypothetical protein